MFRRAPKRPMVWRTSGRRVGTTAREEATMPPLKTDPPGGKPPMISDTGKFLVGAATISTIGYFGYAYFNPRRQPNYRPDAKVPDTKEAIDSAMSKSVVSDGKALHTKESIDSTMNKSIVPSVGTVSDPNPYERGKVTCKIL